MMTDQLTVEAAAIQKDGVVYSVCRPGRHDAVIRIMVAQDVSPRGGVQGFLLSDGTFVNRWKAARVAFRAQQFLVPPEQPPEALLSEDVW